MLSSSTKTFFTGWGLIRREVKVKPVRAIGWADVNDGDAALAERCGRGDDQACRGLIGDHERMVYVLGYQLLGNHDESPGAVPGRLPSCLS